MDLGGGAAAVVDRVSGIRDNRVSDGGGHMVEPANRPINIFFSYAHEDESLVGRVRSHLSLFDRQKIIRRWHDREIPPGAEWKGLIDSQLAGADIVLLFISDAFFASDYCYDVEMTEALKRHNARTLRVIPVILRPCSWQSAPFAVIQALPADGRAVTLWSNPDDACAQIADAIMGVVHDLSSEARASSPSGDSVPPRDTESHSPHRGASLPGLPPVRCSSDLCRSADVELSDAVEIVSLKAGEGGWTGKGSIRLDYSVEGRCLTCGRVFEVLKHAIPLKFPDFACNECGQQAFLKYDVQQLEKVANGYEFGVEIRCGQCHGARTLSRVLTALARTVGIELGPTGLVVRQTPA
jgi:hypothetical protein